MQMHIQDVLGCPPGKRTWTDDRNVYIVHLSYPKCILTKEVCLEEKKRKGVLGIYTQKNIFPTHSQPQLYAKDVLTYIHTIPPSLHLFF